MPDKREAVLEQLAVLRDDLQLLFETVTTDPKERQRRERMWAALYGGLSAVGTLLARRLAARAWGVLTGELPPGRRA